MRSKQVLVPKPENIKSYIESICISIKTETRMKLGKQALCLKYVKNIEDYT
jgi:hypothetical protein